MAKARPKSPAMYDPSMWEAAGIDPNTGMPGRKEEPNQLKIDIKKLLRVKDEQDAVNRYVWRNIPLDMSSQEIERMLYYNHSLIFFYFKPYNRFMLLPYAFDSGLDLKGRPMYVHPVPIASGTDNATKAAAASQEAYLRTIKLKVIYEPVLVSELIGEDGEIDEEKATELLETSCVIIRDYTPQHSENGTPRYQLQDAILDVMADCIPFSRTALLNSTGITGVQTSDSSEDAAVYGFSNSVNSAALDGKKYIPVRKKIAGQFQELTGGNVAKAEEFLQMMQGYNNFRLGMYGLDNNGLYDKKAYVNTLQSGVNNVGLSIQDGISQRENSCNIINSIWGIMMWVEIPEVVSGADRNLDGEAYEEQDQSGQANNAPVQQEGEEQ